MSYRFLYVWIVLFPGISPAQLPFFHPAYELVFSDEFTDSTVDTAHWRPVPPWNQCGTQTGTYCMNGPFDIAYRKWDPLGVGEFDYTNTEVSNGTLKLYTRKENYTGTSYCWPGGVFTVENLPYIYTSAMLYSKKRFKYGYYEIRFRLPAIPPGYTYQGFGPNFWLYGVDPPVNEWSEIDVFEIFGYVPGSDVLNEFTTNIHYQAISTSSHLFDFNSQGSVTENVWHTAGVDWTSDHVHFYLDGQKIKEVTASIPFDSLVPMHIWIDVNAPTTGGCIDFDTTGTIQTYFPYIYEIDYVKVWQMKKDCDSILVLHTLNPPVYTSMQYGAVEMGGLGTSHVAFTADNAAIIGSSYVLLDAGFSIDDQSTILIDVDHPCGVNEYAREMVPDCGEDPCPPAKSFLDRYE